MIAATGRPVLALLDPAQIPLVTAPTALAGLTAGVLAAVALAGDHSPAAREAFTASVLDARSNPKRDYGYSRGFLAGVELAKTELAALAANILGEQS